jgi:Rrf2 family protein
MHSKEIADRLGLPPQFLTKILRRLTATGLVTSQRGRAGGFRLDRPPGAISLLEVVMPFEEPRTEITCLLGQAFCSDHEDCPLHEPYLAIRTAFYDLLENTTLADVAVRAIRRPAPSVSRDPAESQSSAATEPRSTIGGHG